MTADEVTNKSNIDLKGKGNTNQLHFCQDVNTKMENASKLIEEKDFQAAKDELEEGKKLVKKRIK